MSSTPSTVGGFDMELFNSPALAGFDGGNFRALDPPQQFALGDHLVFNGTDEYGTVTGLLDNPPAAGCISMWWEPGSAAPPTGGDTLLCKASNYSGSDITDGLTLSVDGVHGGLSFKITDGGVTAEALIELGGTWMDNPLRHHIVISWGTKLQLFVDGLRHAVATHTGAWDAGADAPFCVAARYLASASAHANIHVDEVEVRDTEPTLKDVRRWFNREGLPQLYELDRWTRNPSNPLLSPTVAEEDNAVFEPQITRIGTANYRGVYTGGADAAYLFGMSSTDGKTLTKEGVVMGHGTGGWAGDACRPFIFNDDGDLYLYFTDEIPTTGGSIHYATTADDGETWTEQGVIVDPDAVRTGYANASVVKVGSTYHWLIEHVRAGMGQAYFAAYFTSTSPTGPLVLVDEVVTDLSLHQGVGSVSSRIQYFEGKFHLFPHLSRSSNAPTMIYHAVSEDCQRWEFRGGGDPVIELDDFSILPRQDQTADCCVYEIPESGEVGMLYDIDDNHGGGYIARICGATFEGSLSDLA